MLPETSPLRLEQPFRLRASFVPRVLATLSGERLCSLEDVTLERGGYAETPASGER
jgi:hypothetical protein